MSLNETPRSGRLHIAIFGRRNSGKSSLINALTGHDVALVSEAAGTTTDPVYKSMELHPIGPVVFIDTAGFDDVGALGRLRVDRTKDVVKKADMAIVIFGQGEDMNLEEKWINLLKAEKTPMVAVINKTDIKEEATVDRLALDIKSRFDLEPVKTSAAKGTGLDLVRKQLTEKMPDEFHIEKILGSLVKAGDRVLLVMPQDIQAPKGRLILPQVQTIRELLDSKTIVTAVTGDNIKEALDSMKEPPNLIITDSQIFKKVHEMKPAKSKLTSFSVLMAAYKGDAEVMREGAKAIDTLTEKSRVLIAEACTHAPLEEDIGREKIPAKLRKICGENLTVDVVSGSDFPEDTRGYDLIIHCGACMFNRKYMMSRIKQAVAEGTPITNYGMAIAHMSGIIDKVIIPGKQ